MTPRKSLPSLLATSVKQHHAALLRVAGVDAVYRRGVDVCELRLVPGNTDTAGRTVEDVAFLNTDSEWIAKREDLIIDGQQTVPIKGDAIEVKREDGSFDEYSVLKPTPEEECWRPSDQYNVLIRIYAKHRGVAER